MRVDDRDLLERDVGGAGEAVPIGSTSRPTIDSGDSYSRSCVSATEPASELSIGSTPTSTPRSATASATARKLGRRAQIRSGKSAAAALEVCAPSGRGSAASRLERRRLRRLLETRCEPVAGTAVAESRAVVALPPRSGVGAAADRARRSASSSACRLRRARARARAAARSSAASPPGSRCPRPAMSGAEPCTGSKMPGPAVAEARRRREAEAAGHRGGEVGEDVAEHVLGDERRRTARARARAASPRCRRACARRSTSGYSGASLVDDAPPQPRRLEHVRLVDRREPAAARRARARTPRRTIRSTCARVVLAGVEDGAVLAHAPARRSRARRRARARSAGRCRRRRAGRRFA